MLERIAVFAASVLIALVLGYAGGRLHAWHLHGIEAAAQLGQLQTNARTDEQEMNHDAQVIADIQADALRRNAARYDAELRRLRDERKERLPEPARAACAGATGAELSGRDAADLVGLARRADDIRAGLEACETRERRTFDALNARER